MPSWATARIPTQALRNCVRKLSALWSEWRALCKSQGRSGDPSGRRSRFQAKLDQLWNIGTNEMTRSNSSWTGLESNSSWTGVDWSSLAWKRLLRPEGSPDLPWLLQRALHSADSLQTQLRRAWVGMRAIAQEGMTFSTVRVIASFRHLHRFNTRNKCLRTARAVGNFEPDIAAVGCPTKK